MYERMLAERNRLQEQINSLQEQIAELPEGKLIYARNGSHCKWYHSDGHNKIYISKKDKHLAEQLATKKYLSSLLADCLQEMNAINFYLRHHNSDNNRAKELLTNIPEYRQLLSPHFAPLSEAIIDMFLYTNKIPFRYECILHLGSTTIFPDFTIRHPKTGKVFYWEHFGLIDNTAYCQKMHSKLQLYTSHGIMPSIQLIATSETQSHPLSSEMVEKIIEYYFL